MHELPEGLADAVEATLRRWDRSFTWHDDGRSLRVGEATVRLDALEREWPLVEPETRGEWVEGALRIVVDGAMQEVVERTTKDFAEAAPRLRPKLWPEGALGAVERGELQIVLRPWTRGLAVGLALAFDGLVVSPTRVDVGAWSEDEGALFERAWANLAAGPSPTAERLDDPNGEVWGIFEGDYFLASHVARLPEVVSTEAPHGFLAVVPHSRGMVVHPLGAPAPATVQQLLSFARRGVEKAPRPLSGRLYWAHGGTVEAVYLTRADGELVLHGSPALLDAAASLGWTCAPVEPVARASFDACLALSAGLDGARLVEIVSPDGPGPLPFDPGLGRAASSYWIVALPDGRYVDAHDEMVFDDAAQLVDAIFIDRVAMRMR